MEDIKMEFAEKRPVKEYRLLLIGKTGAGKSATGNSILGHEVFPTSLGTQSVTVRTQIEEGVVLGHKVVVVDTPGFFDTSRGNDYIMQELIKIFGYLSPGFHALIFVMGPERFTSECIQTKDLFFRTFGRKVADYTLILVTGSDRLNVEGGSFQKFVANANAEFLKFKRQCKNRIMPFNNKATGDEMTRQMSKLFETIDRIQADSGNKCFTNIQFQTMKYYHRLTRKHGADNLKRARKTLFRNIAKRYGVEEQYAWRPKEVNRSRPVPPNHVHRHRISLPNEVPLDFSGSDTDGSDEDGIEFESESGSDDDADAIVFRGEILKDSSYLDRLIQFFARVFRPIIEALSRDNQAV